MLGVCKNRGASPVLPKGLLERARVCDWEKMARPIGFEPVTPALARHPHQVEPDHIFHCLPHHKQFERLLLFRLGLAQHHRAGFGIRIHKTYSAEGAAGGFGGWPHRIRHRTAVSSKRRPQMRAPLPASTTVYWLSIYPHSCSHDEWPCR